jgi:hypothetical protein
MRLRLFRFSCVLALAMLPAACRETTGLDTGSVDVTAAADGLVVINHSERAAYIRAIDRGMTPLDDWAPCVSPRCNPSAAGQQPVVVPWASVIGYGPDKKEFVVYWWYADTLPDGSLRPGTVYSVLVTR